MDTPPQGVAAVSANLSMVLSTKNDPQQLRECHIYYSDGLELDGALRQRLETLMNAEVTELVAVDV